MKKTLAGGGKHIPASTAGFSNLDNSIFPREAKARYVVFCNSVKAYASANLHISEDFVEYHMKTGKAVKLFFHLYGLHSSTVQLEYSPWDR